MRLKWYNFIKTQQMGISKIIKGVFCILRICFIFGFKYSQGGSTTDQMGVSFIFIISSQENLSLVFPTK